MLMGSRCVKAVEIHIRQQKIHCYTRSNKFLVTLVSVFVTKTYVNYVQGSEVSVCILFYPAVQTVQYVVRTVYILFLAGVHLNKTS